MQTLVLIFGTFNPITNAHIRMGIVARELLPLSRIIYIPSKNRFLKSWKRMSDGQVMDGDIRVGLMKEALSAYGFEVDDIEISTDISGKTYDTIKAIKEKYETEDVYICMGTDKVCELQLWYKGEELLAENRYLITSRDGNTLDEDSYAIKKYPENFTLIHNEEYSTVSSSEVRKAYIEARLETVKDSIPENVYRFLCGNEGIYT